MTIPDAGHMMENGAIGIPYTPEEEKRIITELANKAESNLKEGNLYYVVSNRYSNPLVVRFSLLLIPVCWGTVL